MVELLVVIGILSVLMGMLVPTLASARASARAVSCASNLRQIAIASIAYAQRNGGHFPPAHLDFAASNRYRWHGTRSGPGQPFDFSGSPLLSYLQTPEIKRCPDFETPEQGFERSAGGYGYNNHYLGSSTGDLGFTPRAINMPAKMDMIRNAAQKIAFADAAIALGGGGGAGKMIEYSFVEPPTSASGQTSPSMHFRHGNRKANIAWADGHVTRETFTWTYPVNMYGANNDACNLGFFGPRDNSLFWRQ